MEDLPSKRGLGAAPGPVGPFAESHALRARPHRPCWGLAGDSFTLNVARGVKRMSIPSYLSVFAFLGKILLFFVEIPFIYRPSVQAGDSEF